MSATAQDLSEALAEATGKSVASVKAYCVALSNRGWWSKPKRGHGAEPKTDMDAAKLLLALLGTGPREMKNYFLIYANLTVPPQYRTPGYLAVAERLGLPEDAAFLDFLAGFVAEFRNSDTPDFIFWRPYEEGQVDDFVFDGPHINISVQGPEPIASIHFIVEHDFFPGVEGGDLGFAFLDYIYSLWHEAHHRDGPDHDDTKASSHYLEALKERTSRGIRFERSIGGRELTAVGRALREDG